MLKKIVVALAMLWAAVAFAGTDANKASEAELDAIKGIGPSMSKRIVNERMKSDFKSWDDFIFRVRGIGEGNAAKFSADGLTVNGASFKGASTIDKAEKKDGKGGKKESKTPAPETAAKK